MGRGETKGLIKEILPLSAVNTDTKLILANALYFKGKWLEECLRFRASRTKEYAFHLLKLGGDSVKVPFMRSNFWDEHFIGTHDGLKVLRLPYKEGKHDKCRFSMYIFLPDAKEGLLALVEKAVSRPDFIDRHLPNWRVGVGKVRVPRFKISFGFEASEALNEYGLSLLFQPGGLTEMVESTAVGKELFVSRMFHKCFIEVNEEGTEAAAVSVIGMEDDCESPDHSFMFLIQEDTTGAVLFFGHVLNPLRYDK